MVAYSLNKINKGVSYMSKEKDLFQWRMDKLKTDIVSACDKNERFVLRNSIVYLSYLLDHNTISDRNIFEVLSWVLGNKFKKLEKNLFNTISPKEREELKFDFKDSTNTDKSVTLIHKILYKSCKKRIIEFLHFTREVLSLRYKSLDYRGSSDTENKISKLAKMFNLSEQEIKFCTFLFITTAWKNAGDYFGSHLKCNSISGRRYLKTALQMTDMEINKVLSGTLIKSGFCEIKKTGFSATEDFEEYFLKPSAEESAIQYFSKINLKSIALAKHHIDQNKTNHILKLLSIKKKSPTHILFHGASGSGKTSYALSLAKLLGAHAYEITPDENTIRHRAAIMACLNTIKDNKRSLIIVDKADKILKTKESWYTRHEVQDKKWLNQLLEEKGNTIIWITNNIEEIDSSAIQRFSFSLHFKPLNKKQRTGVWESVLCRHRVKKYYNENELKELSNSYPVNAAVIDTSIKKALDISSPANINFKEIVTMNLDAYMELTRNKDESKNKNKIENNYSVEGLNVDGDLDVMMDQIKAYERFLREDDKSKLRNFNLLFYGPPGTGKSEFARYIADHLSREIMCKRCSDIVSKWVGETEQNISSTFAKAEAEEAILIIDEADTFLFNRGMAIRSWEISHTNEFLTQMEKFRGILICTTNMLSGLDGASIRRFNHKIKFDYLKPESNILFYQRLLEPLTKTPIDEVIKNELQEIRQLAPGDFRLIRDRYSFYERSEITHQKLIEALRKESNIKQFQSCDGKKIGF